MMVYVKAVKGTVTEPREERKTGTQQMNGDNFTLNKKGTFPEWEYIRKPTTTQTSMATAS